MGKAIIIVLLILAAIIAIPTAIAYSRSPEFEVERSVVIATDGGDIYPYLSDLKKWQAWTVWTKEKFPAMEISYSGAESGVGAESQWTDPENGDGHLVVTKADPATGIEYEISFVGFPTSECSLRMTETEGGTRVSMKMKGSMGSNPVFRVMGLFMDMEGMIGDDFDESLEKLKTICAG